MTLGPIEEKKERQTFWYSRNILAIIPAGQKVSDPLAVEKSKRGVKFDLVALLKTIVS